MKKHLLTALLALTLWQCNVPVLMQESELEGQWRTDSISNFVNGLSFTNSTFDEHWSTFEYAENGRLMERKKEKFKNYQYSMPSADSLIYSDTSGHVLSRFEILELSDDRLILKKSQKPYLPGKNQELYEIRFFSKITSASK